MTEPTELVCVNGHDRCNEGPFDGCPYCERRAPTPSSSPPLDVVREWEDADMDRMVQIKKLIADLQSIDDRFGNTCVYIRRGGLSWGAVALNRRDDDKKFGVFDLQAQHDRDMMQRAGQVERLLADKTELSATVSAQAKRIEGLEALYEQNRKDAAVEMARTNTAESRLAQLRRT